MNASAPSINDAAPTLSRDDEIVAFTRAIDRIDGLGKNRRQPRRIPLSSRRWNTEAPSTTESSPRNQDMTSASEYNGSNAMMRDRSSSALAEDAMLVDFPPSPPSTTSPTTEAPVGEVAQGHSSSTAIRENLFRRLSSLRSLSTEIIAEREDAPSPSSFTAPVNFGDDSDCDDDASLDPSGLSTVPRRKKRARGLFREQLNDTEQPPSPRRVCKSPHHNLRHILNDIARDCCDSITSSSPSSSNSKVEEDNFTDSLSYRVSDRQDQKTLVRMVSSIFKKPSLQREHSVNTVTTTASTVDGEEEQCDEDDELQDSTRSFVSAFNGDDRFVEDESGWVTLASLLMDETR